MPTNNKAKDLKDSLRFTYLDVENAGFRSGSVTGFGFNNKDLKTQYPSTTTGEPTPTQYPAGPAKRFVSNFGPQNVYLDQVDIIKQNGPLLRSLKSSKLDNIDSPINTDIGDPTVYPSSNVTGKPSPTSYPTTAPKKFKTVNNNLNPYLDKVNIKQENSPLEQSLESSKLDNNKTNGVNFQKLIIEDPTVYPSSNVTGKPSPTSYPTTAPKKFKTVNNNLNPYLDKVNIKQENSPLEQSLESSKLDDDKNPNLDPTIYPLTSKGISSAGGRFPIEGKPPKIFEQKYSFDNTYYDSISIEPLLKQV